MIKRPILSGAVLFVLGLTWAFASGGFVMVGTGFSNDVSVLWKLFVFVPSLFGVIAGMIFWSIAMDRKKGGEV